MRFDMPALDLGATSTRLHRWTKAEGEQVSYGEDICEVLIEEIKVLVRDKHASDMLTKRETKRRAKQDAEVRRTRIANYVVRIVSSDMGYLRKILTPEGASVSTGHTLALLTSDPLEVLPEHDFGILPGFRVIWDYQSDEQDA
jgi:hypothetical protein